VSAKAHFGQILESEGVERENCWVDGGEVEIHRFEVRIRRDDVKDPVQGQVGGGKGSKGERVEVCLEQWRRPLEWHIL